MRKLGLKEKRQDVALRMSLIFREEGIRVLSSAEGMVV